MRCCGYIIGLDQSVAIWVYLRNSDRVLRNIKRVKLVRKCPVILVASKVLYEEITRAEPGLVGNSHRTQIIVGISNDNSRHGCSVIVLVRIFEVWQVKRTGIVFVKAVGEFLVVDVNSVVIDTNGDALSVQLVSFPDRQEIDHLEHPIAACKLRVFGDGTVKARIGGIPI